MCAHIMESEKEALEVDQVSKPELDQLKEQQAKIGDLLRRGDHEGAQLAIKRFQRYLKKNLPTHPARPPKSDRPRCGAMTRKGTSCKMAAVWLPGDTQPRNGRCRIHGGLSTGPNTAAGKAAVAENNKRRAALIREARKSTENGGGPKKVSSNTGQKK